MRSFKKYLALMLALVMCLFLAACGGDNGDSGDDDDVTDGAPDSFEGMVKDDELLADYDMYCGVWVGDDGRELQVEEDEETQEVRFVLFGSDGEELDASGFIQLSQEYSADYFYNEHDGIAYHSWFDKDGTLHIYSFGTFTKNDSTPSIAAGTWYLDGSESATSRLQIGEDGKWMLYEDADSNPSLIDSGSIEALGDGAYSAVSEQFDDVAYDITLTDESTLYWGGENDCYMRLD